MGEFESAPEKPAPGTKTQQAIEDGASEEGSKRWGIYHREREFAREMDDPCLGEVTARTKEEAESKAARRGISGPTGLWADLVKTPNQKDGGRAR